MATADIKGAASLRSAPSGRHPSYATARAALQRGRQNFQYLQISDFMFRMKGKCDMDLWLFHADNIFSFLQKAVEEFPAKGIY